MRRLPIPSSAKRVIEQLVTAPAVGRIVRRSFPAGIPSGAGGRVSTGSWVSPRVDAAILFRLWERAELAFIHDYLRRDLDVVELGACFGVTTSKLARLIDEDRKIVAVEANPGLVPLISKNVRTNAHRVETLHAAIGYEAPTVRMRFDADVEYATADPDGDSLIEAVTLSSLVERFSIDEFVLVCDIEGSEAGIILEDDALARCAQVLMELHNTSFRGRTYSPTMLIAALQERGLEPRYRRGPVVLLER